MKHAHQPPPHTPGRHRQLFGTLLFSLFQHSIECDKRGYHQWRHDVLATMHPELAVLEQAVTPGASAEQLLAALHYVAETLHWTPEQDSFWPLGPDEDLPW